MKEQFTENLSISYNVLANSQALRGITRHKSIGRIKKVLGNLVRTYNNKRV